MPLKTGQLLAHYRIVRPIGQGGMGAVFLAEDTKLGRHVALKVLPPELASSPDRLERFQREAKAVASLNHPHIVTIHSVEEEAGTHFLTMELVEGESLDRQILPGGLPLARVFDIGIALADALAAAHERGIIHRDLKPANVMVSKDGRVKVLDFGLAKLAAGPSGGVPPASDAEATSAPTEAARGDDILTSAGVVMGTVPYMSPEQVGGEAVDARSDIFSLGVLLYELATGRRPFSGKNQAELISSIVRDAPRPVMEARGDAPRHLGRIVDHCLQKDPEARYQSAKDVRNELRALRKEVDSGSSEISGPLSARTGAGAEAPAASTPPASEGPAPSSDGLASPPSTGSGAAVATGTRRPWLFPVVAIAVIGAGLAFFYLDPGRQAPGAGGTPPPGETTSPEPQTKRLVVLPFENMGAAEDDYFAAGIAEEITSRLSSIGGLGVISRTSAMSYAGTDKSIRQIGTELGVDYVMEGSIRWARGEVDRVRITPSLIRVSDDTQVWSETYDRVIEDIFGLQSEIATRVTEALGVNLVETDRSALRRRLTEDVEAYQDYLQGRALQGNYATEGLEKAVSLFRSAVERDPNFVEAYAMMARSHATMIHFGLDSSPERDKMAREAAERALALDPRSADAHVAMGFYHYHAHKNYESAIREFDAAAQIRPGDADMLYGAALVLRRRGKWEESTLNLQRILETDPRNVPALINLGTNLIKMARYKEALNALDKAEAIDASLPWVTFYRVIAHWSGTGDLARARQLLEEAPPGDDMNRHWFWLMQLIFERDYAAAAEYLSRCETDWFILGYVARPRELMQAWIAELMGDEEEAKRLYDAARARIEDEIARGSDVADRMGSSLGLAYAGLGRAEDALREGRRSAEIDHPLSRDAVWGDFNLADLAVIQVKIGDVDGAFETLHRLIQVPQDSFTETLAGFDPRWDPLRADPRWSALVEQSPRKVD